MNGTETRRKLRERIKRQVIEIELMRFALSKIGTYADNCLDGTEPLYRKPAFYHFAFISTVVTEALRDRGI